MELTHPQISSPLLITKSVHAAAPPRRLRKSTSGPVWLQQPPMVPSHGTAALDRSSCRVPVTCRLSSPCFVSPEAAGMSVKLGGDASSAPSGRIHGAVGWTHYVGGQNVNAGNDCWPLGWANQVTVRGGMCDVYLNKYQTHSESFSVTLSAFHLVCFTSREKFTFSDLNKYKTL